MLADARSGVLSLRNRRGHAEQHPLACRRHPQLGARQGKLPAKESSHAGAAGSARLGQLLLQPRRQQARQNEGNEHACMQDIRKADQLLHSGTGG